MGQNQKSIRQNEQQDQTEEQEEIYIEKWDQTGSPEIPDRGGDIINPPALHMHNGTKYS